MSFTKEKRNVIKPVHNHRALMTPIQSIESKYQEYLHLRNKNNNLVLTKYEKRRLIELKEDPSVQARLINLGVYNG